MLAKIKRAWKSLTVWFNAVSLSLLPALDYARDNVEALRDLVSADIYKIFALVVVLGNILLRFRTTKPLEEK